MNKKLKCWHVKKVVQDLTSTSKQLNESLQTGLPQSRACALSKASDTVNIAMRDAEGPLNLLPGMCFSLSESSINQEALNSMSTSLKESISSKLKTILNLQTRSKYWLVNAYSSGWELYGIKDWQGNWKKAKIIEIK